MINQAKDQFSFSPSICSFHKTCNIVTVHQILENLELLLRAVRHIILKGTREDREIIFLPLLILGIIFLWLCQLDQMAKAPAHKITISFQISVLSSCRPDYFGNGLCHRRLFCNNKLHYSSSSSPASSESKSISSNSLNILSIF